MAIFASLLSSAHILESVQGGISHGKNYHQIEPKNEVLKWRWSGAQCFQRAASLRIVVWQINGNEALAGWPLQIFWINYYHLDKFSKFGSPCTIKTIVQVWQIDSNEALTWYYKRLRMDYVFWSNSLQMLHDYPKSETKISNVNSVTKLMTGHMATWSRNVIADVYFHKSFSVWCLCSQHDKIFHFAIATKHITFSWFITIPLTMVQTYLFCNYILISGSKSA